MEGNREDEKVTFAFGDCPSAFRDGVRRLSCRFSIAQEVTENSLIGKSDRREVWRVCRPMKIVKKTLRDGKIDSYIPLSLTSIVQRLDVVY